MIKVDNGKRAKKKVEDATDALAASSASGYEMFKENIPKPLKVGGMLETQASEDDTLMGRLAKRMAARDLIDSMDMGTKEEK